MDLYGKPFDKVSRQQKEWIDEYIAARNESIGSMVIVQNL